MTAKKKIKLGKALVKAKPAKSTTKTKSKAKSKAKTATKAKTKATRPVKPTKSTVPAKMAKAAKTLEAIEATKQTGRPPNPATPKNGQKRYGRECYAKLIRPEKKLWNRVCAYAQREKVYLAQAVDKILLAGCRALKIRQPT